MPDDAPSNGQQKPKHQPRGLSPIVPGRPGRPSFSLDALRERIEQQFAEETIDRADILIELDTAEKRRAVLSEIADYVLASEAVTIAPADRKRLIDNAYTNLFSFGPIDNLLRDPAITAITINGPHEIHAQRATGKSESINTAFDDVHHLERILERVLATAGVVLNQPFLEVGVTVHGRPARISVIGPPVRTDYSLDMRLHPAQPVTLRDLATDWAMLNTRAADLLRAILAAEHGVLVVGDAGIGKTTIVGALLAERAGQDDASAISVVERAAELHLPSGVTRHLPDPAPLPPNTNPFGDALLSALDGTPDWLILDEVRGEESAAVWTALTYNNPPRYLWAFRGVRQPDRLKSALSMVIRREHQAVPQSDINRALVERLPFVITLRRRGGAIRLDAISEWALDADDPAALTLRAVLSEDDGDWTLTGSRPAHTLDLPESFWS